MNAVTHTPSFSSRRLLSVSDLQTLYSPPDTLVDGLLTAGSVVLMWGAPGTGKSMLATYLAGSVATGRDFAGRMVSPRPVVYVAGEAPRSIAGRVLAYQSHYGALPPRSFMLSAGAYALQNERDVEGLAHRIRAVIQDEGTLASAPGLIILDTFAALTAGVSENDSQAVGPVMRNIRRWLVEPFGSSVIVVHHSAKTGETYRGSSALLGDVDLEWRVERPRGSAVTQLVPLKDRDDVTRGEPCRFALEQVTLTAGETEPESYTVGCYVPAGEISIPYPNARRLNGTAEDIYTLLVAREFSGTQIEFIQAYEGIHGYGPKHKAWKRRTIEAMVEAGDAIEAPQEGTWDALLGIAQQYHEQYTEGSRF